MDAAGEMTVASIHIYPVKAGRAVDLAEAEVEPCGLAGDRRWLVIDPDGQFITQRDRADAGPGQCPLCHRGKPALVGGRAATAHPARSGRGWRRGDALGQRVAVKGPRGRRRGPGRRVVLPLPGPAGAPGAPGRPDPPPGGSGVRRARGPGEFRGRLSAAAHRAGVAGRTGPVADRGRSSGGADDPVPAERGRGGHGTVGGGRLAPDPASARPRSGWPSRAGGAWSPRSTSRPRSAAGSRWPCSAVAAGSASNWSSART